jgi:hypothetical protein
LPNHYAGVVLDAFEMIPIHVHAIMVINNNVGAGLKPAPTTTDMQMESAPTESNRKMDAQTGPAPNMPYRAGLKPAPTNMDMKTEPAATRTDTQMESAPTGAPTTPKNHDLAEIIRGFHKKNFCATNQ